MDNSGANNKVVLTKDGLAELKKEYDELVNVKHGPATTPSSRAVRTARFYNLNAILE